MDDTVKITLTSCYYVPPPYGALSDAICPSVRLSVCSSHLGQLGAQRLGQLRRSCPVGHQSCADCGSVRART